MEFRKLKAEEIDVRVGRINSKYTLLLLYKNARVDMQILDETVGAENWQREHYECKGNLFCKVGIRTTFIASESGMHNIMDEGITKNGKVEFITDWVWKSDCGSESNTEKEKGEASDSFKRACVNWGIGRELYTGPTISVLNTIAGVKDSKCYTKFKVTRIGYDEKGVINDLVIVKLDDYTGEIADVVFDLNEKRAFDKAAAQPARAYR